jgi:hypothetical protein
VGTTSLMFFLTLCSSAPIGCRLHLRTTVGNEKHPNSIPEYSNLTVGSWCFRRDEEGNLLLEGPSFPTETDSQHVLVLL